MKINGDRLVSRLEELANIGKTASGGVTRLALSKEDIEARALLARWMESVGLQVCYDECGNQYGVWGELNTPSVFIGSHLDSVKEGGQFDGPLGVLGALEVVETLKENGYTPPIPITIVNFTNEEGVRFTPDMMGSLYKAGGISKADLYKIKSTDGGKTFGEIIKPYLKGKDLSGEKLIPSAYLELHIEQGPVLETSGTSIGAVGDLQGIFWTEYQLTGRATHTGTTPIKLRRDAGYIAAKMAVKARKIAIKSKGKATVGVIELHPSQINATSGSARFTADIRHVKRKKLAKMQGWFDKFLIKIAKKENVSYESKELVRLDPVIFDKKMTKIIKKSAEKLSLSVKPMTSGAGHDAQMMQRICPSAMIFVPSRDGISHNPAEFTEPQDLMNGVNVLLKSVLEIVS